MAATTLESSHVVSIKRNDVAEDSSRRGQIQAGQWSRKNYPEALWSDKPAAGKPEAGMIKDVPSGVVLRVRPTEPAHRLGPFLIEKFKYGRYSDKIFRGRRHDRRCRRRSRSLSL